MYYCTNLLATKKNNIHKRKLKKIKIKKYKIKNTKAVLVDSRISKLLVTSKNGRLETNLCQITSFMTIQGIITDS